MEPVYNKNEELPFLERMKYKRDGFRRVVIIRRKAILQKKLNNAWNI